jgi:hypothetical protein
MVSVYQDSLNSTRLPAREQVLQCSCQYHPHDPPPSIRQYIGLMDTFVLHCWYRVLADALTVVSVVQVLVRLPKPKYYRPNWLVVSTGSFVGLGNHSRMVIDTRPFPAFPRARLYCPTSDSAKNFRCRRKLTRHHISSQSLKWVMSRLAAA